MESCESHEVVGMSLRGGKPVFDIECGPGMIIDCRFQISFLVIVFVVLLLVIQVDWILFAVLL